MMGNPVKFIEDIKAFDKDNIDEWKLAKVKEITSKPEFNYDTMMPISNAAANLCKWAINVLEYFRIYKIVKPLMDKAADGEE
jgi:dynein heavy chain, axonemal